MRALSRWLVASALCAGWLGCSGSGAAGDATSSGAEPEGEATLAKAGEAPQCQLPSGGYASECNTCLAAGCCSPIEACKADPECAEQLSCIVECQHADAPGACSTACIGAGGLRPEFFEYEDCSISACLSACWM